LTWKNSLDERNPGRVAIDERALAELMGAALRGMTGFVVDDAIVVDEKFHDRFFVDTERARMLDCRAAIARCRVLRARRSRETFGRESASEGQSERRKSR
jgi:hypothetical protein